jgi:hypothetical protein
VSDSSSRNGVSRAVTRAAPAQSAARERRRAALRTGTRHERRSPLSRGVGCRTPSRERVAVPPDDETAAWPSTKRNRHALVNADTRASTMHCPGSWGTVEDLSRLSTVASCVGWSDASIPLPVRVQGSDCRSVALSVTDRERGSLPSLQNRASTFPEQPTYRGAVVEQSGRNPAQPRQSAQRRTAETRRKPPPSAVRSVARELRW